MAEKKLNNYWVFWNFRRHIPVYAVVVHMFQTHFCMGFIFLTNEPLRHIPVYAVENSKKPNNYLIFFHPFFRDFFMF